MTIHKSRDRVLISTLILVAAVVAVLSSLGAPLIPAMAEASHVSLSSGEWLLTITLLTGALATPIMGRLADGPSTRPVILISLTVVLAGCVLAALTSNFSVLVAARGLQGLGIGLMPVTMAVARRHLEPGQAASTIATLSVTAAVGVGLGYPITGLLAQSSDYHAAFWFGAVVVAAALVSAAVVIPGSGTDDLNVRRPRFDVAGAVLLCAAVGGLIVVLSEGTSWGWHSPRVLGLLIASLALMAIWSRHELRIPEPLVDLRQARHRTVLTADFAGFVISMTMYLFLPIVVEFVQVPRSSGFGFEASIGVAGCVLIPLSVATIAASRIAPPFERRWGRRLMIPLGAVLFAVAMTFFALEHTGIWEAFVAMAFAGMGIGFTFAAMPGFIVSSVPSGETGSAMGFYQVLRSIGLAAGSAVSAVILAGYTVGHSTYPTIGGFRTALLAGAALCLLVAVVSYLLPGRTAGSRAARRPSANEVTLMEENAELGCAGLMLNDLAGLSPTGK